MTSRFFLLAAPVNYDVHGRLPFTSPILQRTKASSIGIHLLPRSLSITYRLMALTTIVANEVDLILPFDNPLYSNFRVTSFVCFEGSLFC